jgi:N utilization substance protein A
MESTTTYARPELLQVADTVARDKGIDKDEVLEAMEQAIQKAGRSKYGQEYDIRAEIDRRNGEIRLLRFREVVDAVENEATQMPLAAAQRLGLGVSGGSDYHADESHGAPRPGSVALPREAFDQLVRLKPDTTGNKSG